MHINDSELIWCENNRETSKKPKYLYKIIKVQYFLNALRYGDIVFMDSLYPHTGVGVNVDRSEYISREILAQRQIGDTLFTEYASAHRLIYCFTTNIESYTRRNPLKPDEIILRFDFDDVFEFFESMFTPVFYYGRISYNNVEPFVARYNVKGMIKKLGVNMHKVEQYHSLTQAKKHFMKSGDYLLEQEYRFVGVPAYPEDLKFYSTELGLPFNKTELDFFRVNKLGGILVRYQPDEPGHRTNIAVMDLFTKAQLVNGRFNTQDGKSNDEIIDPDIKKEKPNKCKGQRRKCSNEDKRNKN